MAFLPDHDYHIHSCLSFCSEDSGQTTEAILRYAEENGMEEICLTDHFWDEKIPGSSEFYRGQNFAHVTQALPLPQSEKVHFHFGCETEMDRFNTVAVHKSRLDQFDFIIVPTTHMHMYDLNCDPNLPRTVKNMRDQFVARIDAFLDKDLPYHKMGLAHLTCSLLFWEEDQYLEVLSTVSEDTYARLFKKLAEKGCGLELNMERREMQSAAVSECILRPYRIARDVGCKFYLGSDAHSREDLSHAMERFNWMISALALEDKHRFRPFV